MADEKMCFKSNDLPIHHDHSLQLLQQAVEGRADAATRLLVLVLLGISETLNDEGETVFIESDYHLPS